MIAFRARGEFEVKAFHAAALANGGSDEGAPGTRPYYEPIQASSACDSDHVPRTFRPCAWAASPSEASCVAMTGSMPVASFHNKAEAR